MSEIGTTVSAWTGPLRRLWWLPVVVALAAGGLTYGLGGQASYSTYGVINTRAAADLPNDRLDLISDLTTVTGFETVLEGPADDAGISVGTLRSRLKIAQVSGSSLAGVTYTSPTDDPQAGEEIVTDVMTNAAQFLADSRADSDQEDSTALDSALADQRDASQAVRDALLANGGVPPDDQLSVIQGRLINARLDEPGSNRIARLKRQVERLYGPAQDFAALERTLDQATNAVATLQTQLETDAAARAALVDNLAVTFENRSPVPAADTPRFRRVLAATVAGGALAVAVLLAVGALRARRRVAGAHGDTHPADDV